MYLFVNTSAQLSKVPYALYILMYLTIHELYTMYVKTMHSWNPPSLNTGTLPVVHIKFASNAPYMLFTREPGQITRHPYAIETLIEHRRKFAEVQPSSQLGKGYTHQETTADDSTHRYKGQKRGHLYTMQATTCRLGSRITCADDVGRMT